MSNPLNPRAERLPASFKVEASWDGETHVFSTRNISDSGIFLLIGPGPRPVIGRTIKVRLQGNLGCGEEPPTLDMIVVRTDNAGIGLRFLDGQ